VRLQLEQLEARNLMSGLTPLVRFSGLEAGRHPTSPPKGPMGPVQFVPNNSVKVGPTVTTTTTSPESEEEIAVDPNNPARLVAAISDFSQLRLPGVPFRPNTTKYTYSTNDGATWKDAFVPFDSTMGLLVTGDGRSYLFNSDPVVAMDLQGRAYLSDLYFNFDNANGVYVSVGNFSGSGLTFTKANTRPVLVDPDPDGPNFEDKDWIAVDNAPSKDSPYSGNVYASWTHFVTTNPVTFAQTTTIFVARSTDHGQTWSSPVGVSPSIVFDPAATDFGSVVQFSQVAVGPHGEVYVLYELSKPPSTDEFYNDGHSQLWLVKSTNGGQTFSAPRAVTGVFDEIKYADFPATYRYASIPALAVNPKSGDLAIVYPDQVGSEVRMEYVSSTNGGTSFSAPVALNDASAGLRIMPAVAVDAQTGHLWVSWIDTRNSADLDHYDVYATLSTNGTVFKQNVRVTPQLLETSNSDFIGDYTGIAAGGGVAHPVWPSSGLAPDRQNQNSHLQTATLSLSAPPFIARPAVGAVILGSAGQTGTNATQGLPIQPAVTVDMMKGRPGLGGIENRNSSDLTFLGDSTWDMEYGPIGHSRSASNAWMMTGDWLADNWSLDAAIPDRGLED
jgi:hypothetical protein